MPAQVFGCRKKMSAIAVLNHQGAEALYKRMHDLAAQGRQEYLLAHGQVRLSTASKLKAEPQCTETSMHTWPCRLLRWLHVGAQTCLGVFGSCRAF